MGVCLQVKKGLCFCYRWSVDSRRLRKRLDAGAGVGGPAVCPLCLLDFELHVGITYSKIKVR